jgi:hypothetical protein
MIIGASREEKICALGTDSLTSRKESLTSKERKAPMLDEEITQVIQLRHRLRALTLFVDQRSFSEAQLALEELRHLSEKLDDDDLRGEHCRWQFFVEKLCPEIIVPKQTRETREHLDIT